MPTSRAHACSYLQPQTIANLISASLDLPFGDISYKWSNTVHVFGIWFPSFT